MDNAASMIEAMARAVYEKAMEIADEAASIAMLTPSLAADEEADTAASVIDLAALEVERVVAECMSDH